MTYATASYLLHKHGSAGVRSLLSNLRQLCRITTVNERITDDALASQFDDFEDALQYYSALKSNVNFIITRNAKDFKQSSVPVMSAAEYLAQQ